MTGAVITRELFDLVTATAEAGLLAQDVRRGVAEGADASIAFDTLLSLTHCYGVNSRPVAAYVGGLVKR